MLSPLTKRHAEEIERAYPWFEDLVLDKQKALLKMIKDEHDTSPSYFSYEWQKHEKTPVLRWHLKPGYPEPSEVKIIDPQDPVELNLDSTPEAFRDFAARVEKTLIGDGNAKWEFVCRGECSDSTGKGDPEQVTNLWEEEVSNRRAVEEHEEAQILLFHKLVGGEARKDLEPLEMMNFKLYDWRQYLQFLDFRYGPAKPTADELAEKAAENFRRDQIVRIETMRAIQDREDELHSEGIWFR